MGNHHSEYEDLASLDLPDEAKRIANLVLNENPKARPIVEMIAEAHGALALEKRTGTDGKEEDDSRYLGNFPEVHVYIGIRGGHKSWEGETEPFETRVIFLMAEKGGAHRWKKYTGLSHAEGARGLVKMLDHLNSGPNATKMTYDRVHFVLGHSWSAFMERWSHGNHDLDTFFDNPTSPRPHAPTSPREHTPISHEHTHEHTAASHAHEHAPISPREQHKHEHLRTSDGHAHAPVISAAEHKQEHTATHHEHLTLSASEHKHGTPSSPSEHKHDTPGSPREHKHHDHGLHGHAPISAPEHTKHDQPHNDGKD
jgi:hypothetical protein